MIVLLGLLGPTFPTVHICSLYSLWTLCRSLVYELLFAYCSRVPFFLKSHILININPYCETEAQSG